MHDPRTAPGAVKLRIKRYLTNAALLAASIGVATVLSEAVLRYRYADRYFYRPRSEVWNIQAQLVLQTDIGFSWKPGIKPESNIVLPYADVSPPPLSTDEWGVINSQEAIQDRVARGSVDVVGVGDSFMEMASETFAHVFKQRGVLYYNLGIHRQSPPQYNLILQRANGSLRPLCVVYGVFENDFEEMRDFDAWEYSGLDWFSYHSGYWCGPPLGNSVSERFAKKYLKGWTSLYYVLYAKEREGKSIVTGPSVDDVREMKSHIADASDLAQSAGSEFILLLIPSKKTMTDGPALESQAYDEILVWAGAQNLRCLDLRPVFLAHKPVELYYEQDAHWNKKGMEVAAQALIDAVPPSVFANAAPLPTN
jgi:hypothetical protein